MTVSSIQPTGTASSSSTDAKPLLGKDDFLKLLVSQLSHQDPMNPTDSQDFMGQMAQFTSAEQLTNMAKAMDQMSTLSQSAQSVSLIGKTVSWSGADGAAHEGVAESVSFVGGVIKIKVGEADLDPAQIEGVR